jgi:hypothetical protein
MIGGVRVMTGSLLDFINLHTSIRKALKVRYMINETEYLVKRFWMKFVNLNVIEKNYFCGEYK